MSGLVGDPVLWTVEVVHSFGCPRAALFLLGPLYPYCRRIGSDGRAIDLRRCDYRYAGVGGVDWGLDHLRQPTRGIFSLAFTIGGSC